MEENEHTWKESGKDRKNYADRFYQYLIPVVFSIIILGLFWAIPGEDISEVWHSLFRWNDKYMWIYVYGIIPILVIVIQLSINWRKRKREGIKLGELQTAKEKDKITESSQKEKMESFDDKNELENIEDMEQMEIKIPDLTTRTSLMVALRKLNLNFELDEDSNILVTYQGEHFRIIANAEFVVIQIQDCFWYDAPLDELNNLALLHRAVNECNICDTNKFVYTYDKAENQVWVHTLHDILWIPQIPDSEQYLQATFDSMLRSHQLFFRQMEQLRREEFEKQN